MTKFYDILEQIKTKLLAEPFCNTVTTGSIDDIDLNKQNIFPLSHIIVNNCNVQSNTLIFNISILAMDIVDESKKETTDIFIGNDNEQDILNTQLSILNRLISLLKRGDLYSNGYQVEGAVNCEPFVDRFENKLAGWAATLDLIVQNDMTIC
tara:strand:- start:21 stop:476 length:456 start_codon:yes stop_codon:yes gene_type:complete